MQVKLENSSHVFFVMICMLMERHYYMKDVNIFIPEPGNTKAALAVSALARAMKEMNKVAILRCAWRKGQGNIVVGVLTPNVSEKDSTVSFHMFISALCFCFLFWVWLL